MKLTRDDERARRICSLALEFMNASAPITSSDIARSHYPELSPDSFRKAFSRDREMLAACGVILAGHRAATGETLWEADAARSFAGGPELAPADAAALELACKPLVDDPSFPLADNLRFALGKLARSFSESLSAERAAGPSTPRQVAVLRRCLTDRTPVEAHYVNAQGSESRRLLAPYAFFGLRGALYLVAAKLDGDGRVEEGTERTYRVDRFTSVVPLPAFSYVVPQDFSVDDYRRLPFQMGPCSSTAVFEVPEGREDEVRRRAGAQGSFFQREGRTVWSVPFSDVFAAASWAIFAGITPIEPPQLVSAWRRALEGAIADDN